MNKQDFINSLKEKISFLPTQELDERVNFYSEIIDDYIEDGLSEENAVSKFGSIDDVVNEILNDTSLIKLAKIKFKPKRKLEPWAIVLIVLGFPIWFSILISIFSVILSIYVSFWSLVVSIWAVFGALVGSGIGCIISGIISLFTPKYIIGGLLLSGGLICLGLSIFCYYGAKVLTKLLLKFGKYIILTIKKLFVRKENQ